MRDGKWVKTVGGSSNWVREAEVKTMNTKQERFITVAGASVLESRAEECVRALAGIADPEAFVSLAKEALTHLVTDKTQYGQDEAIVHARRALALLTPH